MVRGSSPLTGSTLPAVLAKKSGQAPPVVGALVPLSMLVALALFFTLEVSWVIFLLPAAVAIVIGSVWSQQQRR